MLIATGLLAATLLQGAVPENVILGLPALPNGHYVERLADGSSACGDASARSFDLDIRATPGNPSGMDGDAGELVLALGGQAARYHLSYALSLGGSRPDPEFDNGMRIMNLIDGWHTPADGSPSYPLRAVILTNPDGDTEIVSAVLTYASEPIILIRSARAPGVHGAAMNGEVLQPFERCAVEMD
ncbi:hypothetical protein [Maricaulis salignorans]|uniref:Uncharacterized protein n=1 Tax=Maricaulis salignorans TaxID=144026 RepID=A0A1G9RZ40_9PROT|nr:hypothetical protein [Maricaulis salignorans]SDM28493.1 hypothetical protein SAMN04488568_10850 [Maricaulis salignorans]